MMAWRWLQALRGEGPRRWRGRPGRRVGVHRPASDAGPSAKSLAECVPGLGSACPLHTPRAYALTSARHRAEFDSFAEDGVKR